MKYWWVEYLSCTYLTALILVIHFVHYPSFPRIKSDEFRSFVVWHGNRITPIVFPAMAIELIMAVVLLQSQFSWQTLINFLSVASLWAITGLKSAKRHSILAQDGYTQSSFEDLMTWNRIRALIWCLRFVGISTFIWKST